tara:strand:- start:26 stop:640 length:615 start_codon:yes stop_codon:yes gene_type:complete
MKDEFNKKYIIISKDLQKNLIEFLDEIQFDSVGENDKDKLHKVNFCNWAINELMDSYEAFFPKETKPQKKSRDEYLDETFMDWNLPEMNDEEYNKLVDQVDGFLRAWEKGYKKKNKEDKDQMDIDFEPVQDREFKPRLEDVVEHCSLEEIEDMLKDDPELTKEDRFDLYYEEHERVNRKKKKTYTLNQMLKGNKLTRYKEPPKK